MKVLVQSFSYKRTGYPKDQTGKGGGFVFDCRAIDAYDSDIPESFEYMHLTGLDFEVFDALDRDLDTHKFFQSAWMMASLDILKCLRRGFSVMTVNFGCTAGQHRSVYMAERLAFAIRQAFPEVEVELIHLERPYWPIKI